MVVGLDVCDLTVYSQGTKTMHISDLLEVTMTFNWLRSRTCSELNITFGIILACRTKKTLTGS